MFTYSLKSLWAKKVTTMLFTLALIVVLAVSMLAVNIYSQVQEGFFKTDGQYDIVVGPKGSATSLVMSSLFFSDEPAGTLPYDFYTNFKKNEKLKMVVPIAMGDSYRGASIVGTTTDLLKGKSLSSGKLFKGEQEAVIGSELAKTYNLKVGDKLISSHGLGQGSHSEHKNEPYTLVGILDKTVSSYDNTFFTSLESVWHAHGIEDSHTMVDGVETEHSEQAVTAVLIRSGNMQEANSIVQRYKESEKAQAINPTQTLRKMMTNLDLSKQVAQILCGIIIALSFIVISIMSVMLYEGNKKDVQTLRFIGLSRSVILKFVLYQNIFIVLVGSFLAVALSRVILGMTNKVAMNLGFVLDVSRIYSEEFAVVGVIIILCLLPVILQMRKFSKELV